MGYYVRLLSRKKKAPNWKLQFVSARLADRRETSVAKAPKRTWDISKDRWRSLGFHSAMTVEEARARSKQLNAQLHLKRQEERLRKIEGERITFRLRNDSVLPDEFVAEFEERFIRARGVFTEAQRKRRSKQRYTTWRAAQKIIVLVGLEPTNWFFHNERFYDLFHEKQYSLGYAKSILAMVNLWGHFLTRKLGQPFSPIKHPAGYERSRILEAFYEKQSPRRRPSQSITPERLAEIKGRINEPNFRWLYISVWFGLRPQEIDQLRNQDLWKTEILPTGRKVVWIFQTKIVALPPEDRWKPIPVIFDEQHFALKMITEGHFKRPLSKTIRKYFGSGHDCYGGRKGFVDLMLSRGQAIENISIWMGHSTLNRTWRSYKNKRIHHA